MEPLTPETIILLGSTVKNIDKDKNGKNVLHFGSTEVILVHFNVVNNDCQQNSRFLYTFNSKFSYIKVWFTGQNSKLLR